MGVQLRKPREQDQGAADAWAQGPMPAPESRPHYYVRHGLWRLRAARQVAPWLLIAVPIGAVIAVAAFDGKKIWHATIDHGAKPQAGADRGTFKARGSSRRSGGAQSGSAGAASGSSSGAAGAATASGQAQPASAVSLELLRRIHALRVQIAALLDGGLTGAERVKLWRLRLRLAITFRRLIRAEIAAIEAGGVTGAERARLDALRAQLKKLDARITILRKIDHVLRGGVTADERAKLDDLVNAFLELKAQAPLPPISAIVPSVRVTASAGGTTTGGVAGVSTSVTATTGGDVGVATGTSGTATTATTPGNSVFGHSHKKPKKPRRTDTNP